jgi:hypothetical protein
MCLCERKDKNEHLRGEADNASPIFEIIQKCGAHFFDFKVRDILKFLIFLPSDAAPTEKHKNDNDGCLS